MIRLIALCLLLTGCGAPQTGEVTMLALGDSIMAWHRLSGRDAQRVAASLTSRAINNRSVSGAQFLQSIPDQCRAGPRDWVIVNGEANDLNRTCGCAACDETLSPLVTPDGQGGAMANFTRKIIAQKHRVVLLGYYGTSVAGGPFASCADELTVLSRRLALLAESDPAMIFVDTKDVIDPANLNRYDHDLAHPSRIGTALIGNLIARSILAADTVQ